MPIRPENRDRYPPDWPEISAAIRERAGNKCEACKVPNGAMIRRGTTREGQPVWRLETDSAYMDGRHAETGQEVPDTSEDTVQYRNPARVILTTAHLDHQPENCAPENLRSLCQRCHNAYDAPMRRAGILARHRATIAIADLFPEAEKGTP